MFLSLDKRFFYKRLVNNIIAANKPLVGYRFYNRIESLISLSRITKPTGIWLLYLPCSWSTQFGTYSLLSTSSSPLFIHPKFLVLFLLGSVLMRTAGCILNDIFDRKLDSQVARTKTRPLASGALQVSTACKSIAICCSGGLGVLYMLPNTAAVIALGSLIPATIYPYMKRITYFPQLFLGFSFNWGSLLGAPAVLLSQSPYFFDLSGIYQIIPVILPLYVGGILWTLIYDTIYAHQDIKDDLKIGVKSTAIKFGEKTKSVLFIFSILSTISFSIAGYMNGQSWLYFALLNCFLFPFQLWQIYYTDLKSPKSCWKMFSMSSYYGLAFFLIIMLDSYLLARKKQ